MNHFFSLFINLVQAAPNIERIQFVSSVGLNSGICGLEPDGTYLGCYISVIYTFFVQAAIVLAVVMVMVGGFQWLLATGNSSKISEAKSTISAAIFGLILALTSYLLFAQINSQLVDLQSLDITPVNIVLDAGPMTLATGGSFKDQLVDTISGYCKRATYSLAFKNIYDHPTELRFPEYQKYSFHPQLAEAMTTLDSQVQSNKNLFDKRVYLNSVSDGKIWNSQLPCERPFVGQPKNEYCSHKGDYHYGGPRNKCAFNKTYKPLSCAVDMSASTQDDYALLQRLMTSSGFPSVGVWCEETGTNAKLPDCANTGGKKIGHIHGQITDCYPVVTGSTPLLVP